MIKFVILALGNLERLYCREVCKLIDNTLVNGDFDLVDANQVDAAAFRLYYKNTYTNPANKPVVIFPNYTSDGDLQASFLNYPEIPLIFSGFIHNNNWSGLPQAITYSPDRIPSQVLVSGGESGLSDWFTGAALEFTEEAGYMYLDVNNNNAPVSSFAISNVIDMGGGVTKLVSGALGNLGAVGMLIHITGETGWQNNPNGKFTIQSVNLGSGFVTINHTLGTGSHTGTVTGKIHYMSGAISVAAAKISKIMRARNCSGWEARYCARMTSTNPTRDNTHGYGSIDVAAAIAYSGTIIADPFDTLGALGTLAVSVEDGVASFTHPEILNAKSISLYDNNEEILKVTKFAGESFATSHYPINLGLRTYKLKAFRDNQSTNFSNSVTTNITSLTGLPPALLYPQAIWGDLTVWYLHGNTPKSSKIVDAFQTVSNPLNNNKGIVLTEYLLEDGALVKEPNLRASKNDLLYSIKRIYLNDTKYGSVDPFGYDIDLCGMDFSYADMTTNGDYDFTGRILKSTNFQNAILPDIYLDEVGRQLVLSQVLYCDPKTTVWYTGDFIDVEIL